MSSCADCHPSAYRTWKVEGLYLSSLFRSSTPPVFFLFFFLHSRWRAVITRRGKTLLGMKGNTETWQQLQTLFQHFIFSSFRASIIFTLNSCVDYFVRFFIWSGIIVQFSTARGFIWPAVQNQSDTKQHFATVLLDKVNPSYQSPK